MQKKMIEDHLALAREHVSAGEKNIARQLSLITELERDGHDATQARALIVQFEGLQSLHIADRDRLEKELADCANDPGSSE